MRSTEICSSAVGSHPTAEMVESSEEPATTEAVRQAERPKATQVATGRFI
jgi:hypothetical protein